MFGEIIHELSMSSALVSWVELEEMKKTLEGLKKCVKMNKFQKRHSRVSKKRSEFPFKLTV